MRGLSKTLNLDRLTPAELRELTLHLDRMHRADVVPRTFEGFIDWLAVPVSPVQREIARVCYDGRAITSIGAPIFGLPEGTTPDPSAAAVIAGVCGARAGKSWLLGSMRLLWGALTRDLNSLQPGQQAVALAIAPRDTLRQEVINYALGAMRAKDELRSMLHPSLKDDDTPAEFEIYRPDGHVVKFEGGVATRGGYGGRGRSLTDVLMDEVAFFRDSSYRINDEDIFKGAAPRVLPGGQAMLVSTPWAQAGILWTFYKKNFGNPQDCLTFRATTTDMNPTAWVRQMVERERGRDPDNAAREFDAEFMTGQTTVFFDDELIRRCIDEELTTRAPQMGDYVRAGADFGFRSDSSALAIAHLTQTGAIFVAELMELRPTPTEPLLPSETVKTFRDRCKAHGCSYVTADHHYREAIVEHLGSIGFADAPTAPHEAFVRARTLMREGKVRIPNNERLLRQMREVEGRPLPGGGMSIHMPRWRTGGHGDLAQALVLAVSSFGGETLEAPKPAYGTPQWEAAEQEKRRKALEAGGENDGRFTMAPWRKTAGRR